MEWYLYVLSPTSHHAVSPPDALIWFLSQDLSHKTPTKVTKRKGKISLSPAMSPQWSTTQVPLPSFSMYCLSACKHRCLCFPLTILVSFLLSLSWAPLTLISKWWPLLSSVLFFFIFSSPQWSHLVALNSIPTIAPYFYPHQRALSPGLLQMHISTLLSLGNFAFTAEISILTHPLTATPTLHLFHFNKQQNHVPNSQAGSSEAS